MRKQPSRPLRFSEPFRFGSHARRSAKRRLAGEGLERRDLLSAVPSASILYNPPGTQESLTQTYPTDVFNASKNAESYLLSVVPAGAVTFDKPAGVIPTGTTFSPVTITPEVDSKAVNGTHIFVSYNGSAPQPLLDLTVVSITYGMTPGSVSAHIRNIDTPVGMPDRIPPRTPTSLYINVTPNLGTSGQTVTLQGTLESPATGAFTINGGNSVVLTGSGVVALQGSTQTTPGYAGRMKLGVLLTGPDYAESGFYSGGFSVAAIPIKFVETIAAEAQGAAYGFVVYDTFSSDSGNNSDLDQVQYCEELQPVTSSETGTLVGYNPSTTNGQYIPAIPSAGKRPVDAHTIAVTRVVAPGGSATLNQVHLFQDKRTGATNLPMPNSGYQITFNVFKGNGGWEVTTTKRGLKITVNGATSEAGSTVDKYGNPINAIAVTQP